MMCPRPRPLLRRGRPPPWPHRHACSGQAEQGGSDHANQEGSIAGGGSTGGGGSSAGGGGGSAGGGSGSAASGGGGVKGRSRRMNVAILFLLRHLVGEKTCELFSCHLHVCNREYD